MQQGCTPTSFQIGIKENHFGIKKKKTHDFEVIGFAQSYNDEGCKKIMKHQYKSGRESLKLAIEMDPSFHISYVNLGILDLIENNPTNAFEMATQAEAITSNCPYTYMLKSLCYTQKNDHDQAIRTIQQSIKINPNESIFYINIGDMFYLDRQIEMSFNYWEKANQHVDHQHWIQNRYRIQHLFKIDVNYWISPNFLCLR